MDSRFAIEVFKAGESFLLERLSLLAADALPDEKDNFSPGQWKKRIRAVAGSVASYAENAEPNRVFELGKTIAQGHFSRGISFDVFMKISKVIHRGMTDLIFEVQMPEESRRQFIQLIGNFFADFELGVCDQWSGRREGRIDRGDASVKEEGRGQDPSLLHNAADAVALRETKRNRTETALAEGERKFRTLVDQAPEALFLHDEDITERKTMEKELVQQVQLMDSLMNALPMPIFYKDTQGRYIGCNPEFEAAVGKSRSELMGKTAQEVWPAKYSETYRDKDQTLLKNPGRQQYEYKYIKPDGEERDVIFYKSTFNDETGRVAGIVGGMLDITERKKTEESLRQSEEKFRHISEFAGIGIGLYRPDGTIVHYNELACRHLGKALDEIVGKSLLDIFPQEHATVYMDRIRRTLQSEAPLEFEDWVALPRDNFCFISTYSRLMDSRGIPSGVIIFSQDITLKKRTEEEIREFYEAARSVLAEDSFERTARKLFDTCRRLTGARSGYVALLSETGEENNVLFLESGGMSCLVDPSLPMPIRGLREKCYKSGKAVWENDFAGSSWQKWMPEGHVVLENVLFAPLRIQEKTVGLLGIANKPGDFSERDARIAETLGDLVAIALTNARNLEELEKSEAKSRSYLENAPYGVFIADDQGRFREVNRAACEMTGYSKEELALLAFSDLLLAEGKETHLKKIREIFQTGQFSGEMPFVHRSGQQRFFAIDAVQLSDTRFLTFAADITELIESEIEKRNLEAQLHQSQKMEAVGRLAGGIAHDFNNLLTCINGYSDMVLEKLHPKDPLRADVDEIRGAGERAADLTRQLLAFSRKQVVSPKVIHPNEALTRSQKMLRRIIGEDIRLRFEPDATVGCINIDPGQLDQILVNLAVNARDAMPQGGSLILKTENAYLNDVSVIRSGISHSVSGPFVMLMVQDDGQGMTEEVRQKIFEPFFTTKASGKGTGLGLSTVYGIVEQNQGLITVSSAPNLGTTFKIFFPRVEAQAGDCPEMSLSVGPRGMETILLAEDESTVRNLAKKILERQGYRILEAENGGDAIRKYSEYNGDIHLLLTDVLMPDITGPELALQLKEKAPKLKILYVSGYASDALSPGGLCDDGVHFLQKPFQPSDLTQKVREVLDLPAGESIPGNVAISDPGGRKVKTE